MEKPHYQVVCGVIENRGQVLCMQRGQTRFPYTTLHWEFPGGKIEPGETPEEALRRELWEEMEMQVEVGHSLGTYTHEYPDFTITMQGFLCRTKHRRFHRKEHASHRWLAFYEVKTLPWCEADLPFVDWVYQMMGPF